MEWVYVRDIANYVDRDVVLKGWLYQKRSSGKLHFLQLRDGTGIIQCVVFKGDVSPEVFELSGELKQESSIEISGTVRRDKRSPIGYELSVKDIKLIGDSEGYPITKKAHGIHFLLERRHLWLRSRRPHAILSIRAAVMRAIQNILDGDGFLRLDSPLLTPNACEGTTTLFETEYFGRKAYLSQSGQLYNEATAAAFGKVYCFGPTFRAEKSKTRRHLTEFWMVEPEVAFLELDGLMDLCEWFLSQLARQVLESSRQHLELLDKTKPEDDTRNLLPRPEALEKISPPFPKIHYDDAIVLLQKKGASIKWGEDFGGDEETMLAKEFEKPVMVHHYPAQIKAFYMKRDPDDPKYSLSVDVLAPEGYGEIIGGGQREDDYRILLESIKEHNLPEEEFRWYLDLRRYGTFPHSGFGLGVERTVAWFSGIRHVRETIPFPRTIERLTP